jgi:predicted amidophosphoribosyltransferase
MGLQAMLQAVYPPQCLGCDAQVTTDFALCGKCWRDTPFISESDSKLTQQFQTHGI